MAENEGEGLRTWSEMKGENNSWGFYFCNFFFNFLFLIKGGSSRWRETLSNIFLSTQKSNRHVQHCRLMFCLSQMWWEWERRGKLALDQGNTGNRMLRKS